MRIPGAIGETISCRPPNNAAIRNAQYASIPVTLPDRQKTPLGKATGRPLFLYSYHARTYHYIPVQPPMLGVTTMITTPTLSPMMPA